MGTADRSEDVPVVAEATRSARLVEVRLDEVDARAVRATCRAGARKARIPLGGERSRRFGEARELAACEPRARTPAERELTLRRSLAPGDDERARGLDLDDDPLLAVEREDVDLARGRGD